MSGEKLDPVDDGSSTPKNGKWPSWNFLRGVLSVSCGVARLLAVMATRTSTGSLVARQVDLAVAAGIGRRQVVRLIQKAVGLGLVRVEARYLGHWRLANTYHLPWFGDERSVHRAAAETPGDWVETLLRAFAEKRKAVYGTHGITDDVAARRTLQLRGASFADLLESCPQSSPRDLGDRVVQSFLAKPGRDGYLTRKAHPFSCFVEDLEVHCAAVKKLLARAMAQASNEKKVRVSLPGEVRARWRTMFG